MASTRRSKASKQAEQSNIETYRGHTIQVLPGEGVPGEAQLARGEAAEGGKAVEGGKLLIDGREIPYAQSEDGIHSHEFMFQKFGTPYELAEELIKQWGTAQPKSESDSTDHSHH